jgi:ABC-2 type transport system ATP-binding protein
MPETDIAVSAEGLSVTRGSVRAVVDVSLQLHPGTITGLLGPSGSGKTTLMRAIVGSQRIDSGEVRVLGHAAGSAPVRALVGYMAQVPALYSDLTVLENLRYFASILRLPVERVAEVVRQVDMESRSSALVRELSGGEVSRVSLGVAMLARPPVLILDEPTVGLDPLLRRSLWRLFGELADAGSTLLVSSHVMDEASRCDRLILMRDGSILYQGPRDELVRAAGVTDIESAFIALSGGDPS